MVFNCCVVPWAPRVFDEGFERARRRSKDKSDRRRRSKSKSSKSKLKSKRDKSKKKIEEETSPTIDGSDDADDNESMNGSNELENDDENGEDNVSRSTGQPDQNKPTVKLSDANIIANTKKTTMARPETSKTNESQLIFREPDEHTVKSDPLPASLPKSILADSFYSDDSLENGDLTYEVDYSTCTPLFEALEVNDWGNVLYFLRAGKFFSGGTLHSSMDDPETQVRTWVHCQDDQGAVMWRQLPLHAAICLAAPLVVVQRLVEIYPDALACPDSFGNLPLNLAAKLHGPNSYIFQVVSIKSQRWLQARQDSAEDEEDEEEDITTVTTERNGGAPIPPSPHGPSNDRPMTPLLSEPTQQRALDDGWEYGPETPTNDDRAIGFLQRLEESFESEGSDEAEYNLQSEVRLRNSNDQLDFGNEVTLLHDDTLDMY